MADEPSRSTTQRFFRACLYILGGIVALGLALELLAQFWGWLLLIGVVSFAVAATYRWWRDYR
jgi:1,4-dihydroxy-2-naphthoate octaprenyltransferase